MRSFEKSFLYKIPTNSGFICEIANILMHERIKSSGSHIFWQV